MTISKPLERLLFEAFRRNETANSFERSKSFRQRWLGFGTAATYRPALNAGLMVFHDGRIPPPRRKNWLCLTSEGAAVLRQFCNEFAQTLNK